jgi:hypothetical protein
MCCGGSGHLHKEFPQKGNTASIPTCCNCKLVDGQEPHPSNYRGCRHAKEEMRKRKSQGTAKTTTGRVFSSSHTSPEPFATVLCSNTQQQQPQMSSVAQAFPAIMGEMSAPLPWGTTNNYTKSVQAPNANSSSLNDMFKVLSTIFQQIMTEFNGAETERIMAITKTVLKVMKQNGC